MQSYDVVVIGAGNGGLTAAATLARKGARVMLLERHNIPGGCATSFCRGRFEFEVSLHQLSGVGTSEKPGPLRNTFDRIGILDKIELLPMSDLYRIMVFDKIDVTLKPDLNETLSILQNHFPGEKEAIRSYFSLVYELFPQLASVFYLNDPETSREKYPLYYKYALKNADQVLGQFFKDPLLKLVLSPYWGYMGLPPKHMGFIDLVTLYFAFLEFGPYHIKGGSQAMSNAIADTVIENGGTIRYNCGVEKILVEDGRVMGVVTEHGQEIATGHVVSNASKVTTYTELIDSEQVPSEVFDELRQTSISQSGFVLFMGLDCVPEEVGLHESTNFIFGGTDMNLAYERMRTIEIGDQDLMVLSCYNIIDPDFSPPGTSQVAAVTLKYGDAWMRVPPHQYAGEKYRVADDMLHVIERAFPGLRSHLEEIEVATPLTHMRYLGHPRGAIYGFDHFVKDSELFIPPQSTIKGLFAVGGWIGYNGYQATLDSGVRAALAVLREMGA